MSDDDKKFPVTYRPSLPTYSEAPGYLTTPSARGGFLDRLIGRLVHDHRTRTIDAATRQTDAQTRNLEAREKLYTQAIRTTEAADRFYYETPRRIEDNRESFEHRRTIERINRETEIEDAMAARDAARARRQGSRTAYDYEHQIALQNSEAELANARFRAQSARFGADTFTKTLPLRAQKIAEIANSGRLDAEIDRVIHEVMLDEHRGSSRSQPLTGALPPDAGAMRSAFAAEIDEEMEIAIKTHQSADYIGALATLRSRVSSQG